VTFVQLFTYSEIDTIESIPVICLCSSREKTCFIFYLCKCSKFGYEDGQTDKHFIFPLVYKLIELTLILSVSTTSVERAFSAMKIIKTKLRNKINDEWFNDLMKCYTEREIFKSLDDVDIIRTFTAKRSRKGNLPPNFM
jgi:hypothetical protein